MHTAWRRRGSGNGVEPPIELRFVDLFMILVTTLIFITVVLSIISAFIGPPETPVPVPEPPTILTRSLPPAVVGRSYEVTLAMGEGEGGLGWALVEGSLPENLSFDGAQGRLSGVPAKRETAELVVALGAGEGAPRTARLTLEVVEEARDGAPAAVPLVVVAPRVLLADAVGKQLYEAHLEAAGGTPPFRWSLVDGELPPGLGWSAAGILEGTPKKWKDPYLPFTFSMKAVDAAGAEVVKEFLLKVMPPPKTLWGRIWRWALRILGWLAIVYWIILFWTGGSFPGLREIFRRRTRRA